MVRGTERLRGLDTLRAFAILAVMSYHLYDLLPEWMHPAARFGWIGVDLFFVLSGYLIAFQLFRPYVEGHAPRPGTFYGRRLWRVLPTYLVVLLLYLMWPAWRETPHMSPAWEFFSFTENLFVNYRVNHAFSHVWSLCVEEHFYLVLPLLVLLLMRKPTLHRGVITIAFFVLAGMVIRSYVVLHVLRPLGTDNDSYATTYIEKIYNPTYTRLDGLIAGVSLAALLNFRPLWWSRLRHRGHSLLAMGLFLMTAACWSTAHRSSALGAREILGTIVGFPLLALGIALVVASALTENGLLRRIRVPGAQTVATLAFSLYLSHKAVVHLVGMRLPESWSDQWWVLPIDAAACLGFAAMLYLCVERPCLRLRDRQRVQRRSSSSQMEALADPAL